MIELREPPARLFAEVVTRLREEEQLRLIRRKFFAFCAALVASLFGLVVLVQMSADAFVRSGFSAYASLLFSDGGTVLQSWRELGYSLLESLPVLTLIPLFVAAILFLTALQFILKEFKRTHLWILRHPRQHRA